MMDLTAVSMDVALVVLLEELSGIFTVKEEQRQRIV